MWIYCFINRLLPALNNVIEGNPVGGRRRAAENLRITQHDGDAPQPSSSATTLRAATISPPTAMQKLRRSVNKAQIALRELGEVLDTVSPTLE